MKIKQVDPNKPKVALLLTGGGARAAYQVGVLKALAHSMPRTAPLPFRRTFLLLWCIKVIF